MLKAIADDATTKAVALAGGYATNDADGVSANNDKDIKAIVGSGENEKELEDDIFAASVALRAITKTGKFGAKGEAAKAPESIGDKSAQSAGWCNH
ncbi:variable large family protein [Borrelia turcica]|uniref:variable large family protein n=1 Tax=Borrelia turcica TaxID=229155 RepID=UPI001374C4F8